MKQIQGAVALINAVCAGLYVGLWAAYGSDMHLWLSLTYVALAVFWMMVSTSAEV